VGAAAARGQCLRFAWVVSALRRAPLLPAAVETQAFQAKFVDEGGIGTSRAVHADAVVQTAAAAKAPGFALLPR